MSTTSSSGSAAFKKKADVRSSSSSSSSSGSSTSSSLSSLTDGGEGKKGGVAAPATAPAQKAADDDFGFGAPATWVTSADPQPAEKPTPTPAPVDFGAPAQWVTGDAPKTSADDAFGAPPAWMTGTPANPTKNPPARSSSSSSSLTDIDSSGKEDDGDDGFGAPAAWVTSTAEPQKAVSMSSSSSASSAKEAAGAKPAEKEKVSTGWATGGDAWATGESGGWQTGGQSEKGKPKPVAKAVVRSGSSSSSSSSLSDLTSEEEGGKAEAALVTPAKSTPPQHDVKTGSSGLTGVSPPSPSPELPTVSPLTVVNEDQSDLGGSLKAKKEVRPPPVLGNDSLTDIEDSTEETEAIERALEGVPAATKKPAPTSLQPQKHYDKDTVATTGIPRRLLEPVYSAVCCLAATIGITTSAVPIHIGAGLRRRATVEIIRELPFPEETDSAFDEISELTREDDFMLSDSMEVSTTLANLVLNTGSVRSPSIVGLNTASSQGFAADTRLQKAVERLKIMNRVVQRRKMRDWAEAERQIDCILKDCDSYFGLALLGEGYSGGGPSTESVLKRIESLEDVYELRESAQLEEQTQLIDTLRASLDTSEENTIKLSTELAMLTRFHPSSPSADLPPKTVILDIATNDPTYKQLHDVLVNLAAERDRLLKSESLHSEEKRVSLEMVKKAELRTKKEAEMGNATRRQLEVSVSKIKNLQQQLETANLQIQALRQSNQQQSKEITSLKAEASVAELLHPSSRDRESYFGSLIKVADEAQHGELSDVETDRDALRKEVESLTAELEGLTRQNTLLKRDLNTVKNEMNLMQSLSMSKDLSVKESQAQGKVAQYQLELSKERSRVQNMEIKIELLEGKVSSLKDAVGKEAAEKESLRRLMGTQQRSHQAMVQSLLDSKTDAEVTREEAANGRIVELRAEIDRLTKQVLGLEERNKDLMAELETAVGGKTAAEKDAAVAAAKEVETRGELLRESAEKTKRICELEAEVERMVKAKGERKDKATETVYVAKATVGVMTAVQPNWEGLLNESRRNEDRLHKELQEKERQLHSLEERNRHDYQDWMEEKASLVEAAATERANFETELAVERERTWVLKKKANEASHRPVPITQRTEVLSPVLTDETWTQTDPVLMSPCPREDDPCVSLSPAPSTSVGRGSSRQSPEAVEANVDEHAEQDEPEPEPPVILPVPAPPTPAPAAEQPAASPTPVQPEAPETEPSEPEPAEEEMRPEPPPVTPSAPRKPSPRPRPSAKSTPKPSPRPKPSPAEPRPETGASEAPREAPRKPSPNPKPPPAELCSDTDASEAPRKVSPKPSAAPKQKPSPRPKAVGPSSRSATPVRQVEEAPQPDPSPPNVSPVQKMPQPLPKELRGRKARAVREEPPGETGAEAEYEKVRYNTAKSIRALRDWPVVAARSGSPGGVHSAALESFIRGLREQGGKEDRRGFHGVQVTVREALVRYYGSVNVVMLKVKAGVGSDDSVKAEHLRRLMMPCGVGYLASQYIASLGGTEQRGVRVSKLKDAISPPSRRSSHSPAINLTTTIPASDPTASTYASLGKRSASATPRPVATKKSHELTPREFVMLEAALKRLSKQGTLTPEDVLGRCSEMDQGTRDEYHEWLRSTFLGGAVQSSP